jgi:hypothetical protein
VDPRSGIRVGVNLGRVLPGGDDLDDRRWVVEGVDCLQRRHQFQHERTDVLGSAGGKGDVGPEFDRCDRVPCGSIDELRCSEVLWRGRDGCARITRRHDCVARWFVHA